MNEFRGKQDTFYFSKSRLANVENRDIPLVLVLGWAGSQDIHVYKYAKIYEDFGYHTIRFAPSTKTTLFKTDTHIKLTWTLLDIIKNEQNNLTECPIVIHTFSNAGLFIYRHISDIVHSEEHKLSFGFIEKNLKALIFDSGPGWPESYSHLSDNVTELVQNQVNFKPIAYILANIGIAMFAFRHRLFLFKSENYFTKFFTSITNDKFSVPTLLMYSTKDRLLHYKYIESFIVDRKKLKPNLLLDSHNFIDSEHCMHYTKYPNEYLDKIKTHLSNSHVPTDVPNNQTSSSSTFTTSSIIKSKL